MTDVATTENAEPARGRQGRRASNGGGRKRDAEVLAAATKVFYEKSYAEASVQDVADELGILKGSLYHYIKTKEDLLYGLLVGVHEEVGEILREVAAVPDLAPLDRLRLYVTRQIEFNTSNLMRISIYYHDVNQLTEDRRKDVFRHRGEHEAFVTDLIKQAQATGDADPEQDAAVLANCVFASMIWLYRWYKPGGRLSQSALSSGIADFVLGGVRFAGR